VHGAYAQVAAGQTLPSFSGHVEFRDVSFRWEGMEQQWFLQSQMLHAARAVDWPTLSFQQGFKPHGAQTHALTSAY
jgi:hypothetical protein